MRGQGEMRWLKDTVFQFQGALFCKYWNIELGHNIVTNSECCKRLCMEEDCSIRVESAVDNSDTWLSG